MAYPKVLLAAPISNKKEYCLWEWIGQVNNLSYPNYEVALCDNSISKDFHKTVAQFVPNCFHVDPQQYKNFWEVQAASLQKLREYFLENEFDYLFSLECDIFPKYDIIESLLLDMKEAGGSKKVQVIGYPYLLDVKDNLAVLMMEREAFLNFHADKLLSTFSGFMRFDGKIEKTFHLGLGCIIFSRSVIEMFSFRTDNLIDNPPDFFFHEDLYSSNVPVHISKKYMPKHYNSNWSTMVY